MSELTRIEDLAQRVADGLADEAMIAELEALMHEDPSARVIYLQTLQLHQDLERKSAGGALSGEHTEMDAPIQFPAPPVRRRRGTLLAAAAALILSAVGAWVWFAGSNRIGEMVEVSNAQWQGRPPAGKLNPGRRLQLGSGSVELRLVSGVRVVLQGQTDVVLRSAMEIELNDGQLFAEVPDNAHGFRVTTPGLDVIDRGTQFGVRVGANGADVHVFDGEVEVESETQAQAKRTLTTAQAAHFTPKGKLENWVAPDYEGFGAPVLAPGVISTTEAVHWFAVPPSTFGFTEGDSAPITSVRDRRGKVALVLERRNVLLEQPLDVTFDRHKRGTNSAYDTHVKVLEAGTRVDSYLMHFNPSERLGRGPSGGVQFDRPIIGVIARGDQLRASDAILGLPELVYPDETGRGLEGDSDVLDVIKMEGDQMGVAFSGQETGLDQVRILLESRSPTLLQPQGK